MRKQLLFLTTLITLTFALQLHSASHSASISQAASTATAECKIRAAVVLAATQQTQETVALSRKEQLSKLLYDLIDTMPKELIGIIVGYIPYFDEAIMETLDGHNSQIIAFAFFPDKNTVASASSESSDPIKIWDLYSGRCQQEIVLKDADVDSLVALSPTRLVVGWHKPAYCNSAIDVFDLATGERVRVSTVRGFVASLIFLATQLVSCDLSHCMKIWKEEFTNKWRCVASQNECGALKGIDKDSFICSDHNLDKDSTIWTYNSNAQVWSKIKVVIQGANSMTVLPHRKIACAKFLDNRIEVQSLDTGDLAFALEDPSCFVAALVAFPGNKLASMGNEVDSTIKIWDLNSKKHIRTLAAHKNAPSPYKPVLEEVCVLAVSPDGKLLISGYKNGTIRFWDVDDNFACIKINRGSESNS